MLKNGDNMDYTEKMKRCHEYVESLEEEQKKIQVFQRELPLCLELVTKAIVSCRKELSGQSECSERTTSDCGGAAVFEEFIPIKGMSSCSSDENDNKDEAEKTDMNSENNGDKKKSDWLRSVQLWNQSSDPNPKEDEVIGKKVTVVEIKRNAGAFQPFQKAKNVAEKTSTDSQPLKAITPTPTTTTTSSSTTETVEAKRESDQHKQSHQSHRKQRRCWSPELHRRFVNALQQLGGSHAATPKQIRDLMKVDGLTNDEVKSHLQKYRLHTRRPTTPAVNNGGENLQQPQFMVVEGIWVPSQEVASNRVYAPVAAKPPQSSASGERSNRRCKSPATPSSRHTTTSSTLINLE